MTLCATQTVHAVISYFPIYRSLVDPKEPIYQSLIVKLIPGKQVDTHFNDFVVFPTKLWNVWNTNNMVLPLLCLEVENSSTAVNVISFCPVQQVCTWR